MAQNGPLGDPSTTQLFGASGWFSRAIELIPDGVIVADLNGRFVGANAVAEKILGLSRSGITERDYNTPEWRITTAKGDPFPNDELPVARVLRTGRQVMGVEHAVARPDGSRAILSVNAGPLLAEDGRIQGVIAVISDVTERKQAEEQLASLAQRLDSHMQNSPLAVIEWDTNYRVIRWSDEAERVFGWSATEVLGKTIEDLHMVYEPDWHKVAKLMEDMSAGSRPRSVNPNRNYRKDGSIIWCEWYNSVLKDAAGNLTSVLSLALDVTEREVAMHELAEARADAERHAAELETLIQSMADGVLFIDSEGTPILANQAARLILGGPPDSPIQEWIRDFRLCDDDGAPLPRDEWSGQRALRGEMLTAGEYRFTSRGAEGIIGLSASPVRDAEGRIVGAAIVFRNITEQAEFERRKEALYQREHHIAEMLQKALIPPDIPTGIPGFTIAGTYQPALKEAEVGGDFYDVFPLEDGKIGVLIGDVVGKGLNAAIHVAATRHTIRSYAFLNPSPGAVMSLANEALCKTVWDETPMVTVFFGVIDVAESKMVYACCGHLPPVLCDAEGNTRELDAAFGIALGVVGGYTFCEATEVLKPGDTVVLFTDGISEARKNPHALFDRDGVMEHMSKSRGRTVAETASGLLKAATDYAGGNLQDDAAILVIRREGVREERPEAAQSDGAPADTEPLRCVGTLGGR